MHKGKNSDTFNSKRNQEQRLFLSVFFLLDLFITNNVVRDGFNIITNSISDVNYTVPNDIGIHIIFRSLCMCFRLKVRHIHCAFHAITRLRSLTVFKIVRSFLKKKQKRKHRSYFANEINSGVECFSFRTNPFFA